MQEALKVEPENKDQLGETNLRVTKLGQAIFKEVNVLLAKVKDIKKRCAAHDKEVFAKWKAEQAQGGHKNPQHKERSFIMIKPDGV